MPDKLKLAFIGCGAIARFHLDGIKSHAPRIDVTALVDLDESKAQTYAAETGGQAFTSLDEALAKGDFDAVDIMLPHDLHEPIALQCLAADKHVLLEKPMAPTLDACDRILAAANAAPGVFMVAENSQYWPEIVEAQKYLAPEPSARSSPPARPLSILLTTIGSKKNGPGATKRGAPAAALPSTAARTGSAPCACGWAKSKRWSAC